MIIISDCFTSKVDEGCLKVANSLAKKMKTKNKNTVIVSYDRRPNFSDKHLELNKLFLNRKLFSTINKSNSSVLYIPFASNTLGSVLRVLLLSFCSRKRVNVIFVLRTNMNEVSKLLLKMSGANVIALSNDSYSFYTGIVGKRTFYLKTGIDTEKFIPVDADRKMELKNKYGIPNRMKVVLHVGHLKGGRNVDKMLNIDEKYFVLLVVSSVTQKEKDATISNQLENRPNTRIIDAYIENIQEIYQLSDVYLFLVQAVKNCIDVPLSVLEAAACNIPIVTTAYGELNSFVGCEGFNFIELLDKRELNRQIDAAVGQKVDTRKTILPYDWQRSIEELENIVDE
ncbi:glycosyltransferase [Clostridium sp. WILCCON 0269]|uniref:Glycosyltransferase n=1 Tax=Candidatus Clostridium eludens TaxID=3381663 RepID=A0ABW8SHI5_9CLOT